MIPEGLNLSDPDVFYHTAFARNIGILDEEEIRKLRDAHVAVAGVGGVGGFHLWNLVRLGVGGFRIADMDRFEAANIQRQAGAYLDTLGANKAEVMARSALAVNPHLEIRTFAEGLHPGNIDAFLDGADMVLDGIDFFNLDTRRLLFKAARERGIPAITAGPLGYGSALLVFTPEGMSFDAYFDLTDETDPLEALIAFAVGLAPAALHMAYLDLDRVDLTRKQGPALVTACNLSSVLAVTEALRILLGRGGVDAAPHYVQFDPYRRCYRRGYLAGGNRHPRQRLKRWYLHRRFSGKSSIFPGFLSPGRKRYRK